MPMEGIINASSSRAADGSYEKDMSVEFDTSKHHGYFSHERDTSMNDIAGLMALMQGNMTKDLPGMLALCKDKGYDGQQWWWIIILLFFLGGGNLGWGSNNRTVASELIGSNNLQTILDRLSDVSGAINLSAADSANRFSQLDTNLCSSIANVINQVRNQGDRVSDNLNSVSRQIADCCCDLRSVLAGISCEVRGVARDVNDARMAIDQRIALSEERLGSKIELGNERLACLIKDQAKDSEIARQGREICALQNALNQSTLINKMNRVAARSTENLEEFFVHHYTPNATTTA